MAPRKDSDGNPINRDRRSRTISPTHVDNNVRVEADLLSVVANPPIDCLRTMNDWTEHDGGYLKLRRATDSQDLHLTWTWSIGAHAGKYVYVRCEYWRFIFGLELLWRKVLEVEHGSRKASPDTYARR